MKKKPTWEIAYSYSLDRTVTIDQVLNMRKGNDPRAGDLWCHKECYPNTGERLLSRRCTDRECYFASWPSEHLHQSACSYFSVAKTKRETLNYAQFYHDMRLYFSQMNLNEEPFFIKEIEFPTALYAPDITITHSEDSGLRWSKTHIVIVDSNKKREKKFTHNGHFMLDDEYYLVIKISEFTRDQLANFQRTGIERIELSWSKLKDAEDEYHSPEATRKREIEKAQHLMEIRYLQTIKKTPQQRQEERDRERQKELKRQRTVLEHPETQRFIEVVKENIRVLEKKQRPLLAEVQAIEQCESYHNGVLCEHLAGVPFEKRRITDYGFLHHEILDRAQTKLAQSYPARRIQEIKFNLYGEVKAVAEEQGINIDDFHPNFESGDQQ